MLLKESDPKFEASSNFPKQASGFAGAANFDTYSTETDTPQNVDGKSF